MARNELQAEALYRPCRLADSGIKTTDDLEPLTHMLGQPRALEAIRLGVEIRGDGYNVFALGDPGIGKRSMIRQFLEQRAPKEATPPDWCYVNNFDDPEKPVALSLPPGMAPQFQTDMQQMLRDVQTILPQAFGGDAYRQQSEALQREAMAKHQQSLEKLTEDAKEAGFKLQTSPQGVAFQAVRDGKSLTPEEIEALDPEERKKLEARAQALQEKIMAVMTKVPELHREARERLDKLNRDVARNVVEPIIGTLQRKYSEHDDILKHLGAVRQHLLQHAHGLLQPADDGDEEMQPIPMQLGDDEPPVFRAYKTNVIVARSQDEGAPVIYEENPTFDNLIGRVEYVSRMGVLMTDFNLIKPGALHRANGGYLILEAHRLITNAFAWDALKQALLAREIRIESPRSLLGVMTTKSLEPQPIPLDVKVILIGNRQLFYMLEAYDPDFPELVKVHADFADEMDRSETLEPEYARLLATLVKRYGLFPFGRDALERVIEQSSRMAADSKKLSIRVRTITGLLRESTYWARQEGREIVTRVDVQRAIDAQRFRSDRAQSRLRESVARDIQLVATSGERIGQINGLAVYAFGEVSFGHPSRITARTRLGEGTLVDIEREVQLGGPSHSKGVLILQGFVTGRYAQRRPFALSASIVFEQNYGGVDGDSASCAEVFALLSAIAEVPLKQCYAVTGSVNQWGDVQAIGGVNEKVEGFFDICNERGLDGGHGAVIPASNVEHLMLREDVVDAVKAGRFHIYAIKTIDEGIELFTGMTAGEANAAGDYPEGSFNALVAEKVEAAAQLRKDYAAVPRP